MKNAVKIFAALLAACLSAPSSLAVNGISFDPSQNIYSARQLGLGGMQTSFAEDASGVFINPAGVTKIIYPNFTAASRRLLMEEAQYNHFGIAVPTSYGLFGFGYVGYGVVGSVATYLDPATGRIMQNPSAEAGSYSSTALSFAYAREIAAPLKASVGGNLKLLSQQISGTQGDKASAYSLDLSLNIKPLKWLSASAALQNILGGNLVWSNSDDKIGSSYKIGGEFNLLGASGESLSINSQQLKGAIDVEIPAVMLASSKSMLYHAGLEYNLSKEIALRTGLDSGPSGSSLTYGIGFVNQGFRFDYAYAPRVGIAGDNPHFFTLSYIGDTVISYDQKIKERYAYLKTNITSGRLITSQQEISIKGEAYTKRVAANRKIWTVPSISSTFESNEVVEKEPLKELLLNGKAITNTGSFDATLKLSMGLNIFNLFAVAPSDVSPKNQIASAEIKVLRIEPFIDIPANFWAEEPIATSVALKLVTGYPGDEFRPTAGISRGELVTLLVRSLNISDEALNYYHSEVFADVPLSHWANKYVGYGSSAKYVTGYPDRTFRPNKVLSRAEAIAIFSRYAGLTEAEHAASVFPDLNDSFWGNKFIVPAKNAGLLAYLDGQNFDAAKEFSRAEACEVLSKVPNIKKRIDHFWETGSISL